MKKKLFMWAFMLLLIWGCSMTVTAAPKKMPDGTMFDAQYYAHNNPDVVAVFGWDENMLYQHYLMAGKFEGRRPCEPIKTRLIDLEIYNGKHLYKTDITLEDTWGNVYMNAINLYNPNPAKWGWGRSEEIVYLINGEYDHIQGCLAYEKCEETYGQAHLEIYADGRHLYSSPIINDDTRPVFFDVALGTNCHKMEIHWVADDEDYDFSLILANAVVY